MHQTTFQHAADFGAAPQLGHCTPLALVLVQALHHAAERLHAVVIRHGEMAQAQLHGLISQGFRAEAAIAAERVAVEIQLARTAFGVHPRQNCGEWVLGAVFRWHWRPPVRPAGGASGHRTEWMLP